jgi:hypothetical protein
MTGISQIESIKGSVVIKESVLEPRNSYITFCQVCSWYGYPFEKIIREFEGIRSEEKDGFVDKFTEYDYGTETGHKNNKHIHKYDPKLVQDFVDLALKMRNGGGNY